MQSKIDINILAKQLQTLQYKNLFTYENNKMALNKLYKVGFVKSSKDKIYIHSHFDDKFFEVIQGEKSLNEGDLILAKVIFNPRGKIKVKLDAVLELTKDTILLYCKDNQLLNVKTHEIQKIDKNEKYEQKENNLFYLKEKKLEYMGNLNEAKMDDFVSLYGYKQDYRLDIYKYNLKPQEENIDYENRVDLRELDFCTIDPKTAKDHDDAIYYDVDENILYVAIADVSSYVKEGSALDKEAYKRAFSVYFPNKVLPMLPFSLSAGICSLKPNEIRHAFVCKIYFNKDHSIKKSEFLEAIIESKNNFAYEYIDALIEKKQLNKNLKALLNITQRLRKKRLLNGFDFRNTEYRLILDKDENLVDYEEETNTISHHLVEECMLLANKEAAKKLGRIGIFRIHEEPDIKKIDTLIEKLQDFGLYIKKKANLHATILDMQKRAQNLGIEAEVDKLIIESQQQARYSNKKSKHFGLGFSDYSHFTSPIRRYADLVLHRILKTDIIPQNIEEICVHISDTEREIALMVWDLEDRKYARWAKSKISQTFKAKVIDNSDDPKIELNESMPGLRARVTNYAGEKLFSKVIVKITHSDFISKNIECKIIGRY